MLKVLGQAVASSRNPLQELSNIWFSGDSAIAYNDMIGIKIAFETDFRGGIAGDKIIGVLENSGADQVDIGVEEADLLIKMGRRSIRLLRQPYDDWFWDPKTPDQRGFAVDKSFRDAIGCVLVSVGASSVINPEQRGVTIVQDGGVADLYATDAVTLSWMEVDGAILDKGKRVILPTEFCEILRSLRETAELCFVEDEGVYCLTKIDVGGRPHDAMFFSKLVPDDNPVNFRRVVDDCVRGDKGFKVPSALQECVDCALVIMDDLAADFGVKDGALTLYAATSHGEVNESIDIGDYKDISVKLDVRLMKRALAGRERISISDSCIVLTGPAGFTHIMSTK